MGRGKWPKTLKKREEEKQEEKKKKKRRRKGRRRGRNDYSNIKICIPGLIVLNTFVNEYKSILA